MPSLLQISVTLASVSGMAFLVAVSGSIPESQVMGPKVDLQALSHGLATFASQHGRLPTQVQGLRALVSAGLLDRIPDDPWHRSYVYVTVSEPPGFKLYSRGANGVDEHQGGDDITAFAKNYTRTDYREFCLSNQIMDRSGPALLLVALFAAVASLAAGIVAAWQRSRRRGSAA